MNERGDNMSSRQNKKKGTGDIGKLLACVGEYKKAALLSPLCMVGEVSMEILIPFLMSKIIDVGIANGNLPYVAKVGLLMILMAMISLCFGAGGGHFAAVASSGFAKNIRKKLFDKIQDRLTTDVTNTQNSFANIIRGMIRGPLMLICAVIMAVSINAQLSLIFLVAVPVLGSALAVIAVKAYPRSRRMLDQYDSMNASVQEDLVGIRVVKAFVRSDHESEKFRQEKSGAAFNCQYAVDELCNLCLYDRGILVWRTADYCGKYANRRIFQLFKLLDANAYFFDDDFHELCRIGYGAGLGLPHHRGNGRAAGHYRCRQR